MFKFIYVLVILLHVAEKISAQKCCLPSGEILNCPSSSNNCCGGFYCDSTTTAYKSAEYNGYIFYTPWYMKWYFWLIIAMIFFLCSGSYTLCKKKTHMSQQQPSMRRRTTALRTSHELFRTDHRNSTATSASSRLGVNDDYSQYYTNNGYSHTSSADLNEPAISFIDTPPPPYWQIVRESQQQQSNGNQQTTLSIPNSPMRPPPAYLSVSNLNKSQESK